MVHGCMLYTERAEMAAVSCGTSHASAVSTPLRWICKKCAIKSYSHSCRITCKSSESARERRIALYKSDYQQIFQTSVCQPQQTLAAVVTSVQSICRTFKSNYKLRSNLQTWLVACLLTGSCFLQSVSHQWTDGYFPDPNIDPQVDQAYFAPHPPPPPPRSPPPPHLPHGFNYDISKTRLLYRLSPICFYHLRTLSKNRTNKWLFS